MFEIELGPALLDLRAEDGWEQKKGGWSLTSESLDVRAMAQLMVAHDARFVTVTAQEVEHGEIRLDYHWDRKGTIHTFSTRTRENRGVSISDLCPAADWIEREIHEYFAVEFDGRDNMKPLMLRPGLEPGINRRQGPTA